MITDPYKTAHGNIFGAEADNIRDQIKEEVLVSNTLFPSTALSPSLYIIVDRDLEHISPFNHPIIFEKSNGGKAVAIDVRRVTRRNMNTGEIVQSAQHQYEVLRALLTIAALEQGSELFKSVVALPMQVYGQLMSRLFVNKLSIDPTTAERVLVMATAFFYINLVTEDGDVDDLDRHISVIAKKCSVLHGLNESSVYDFLTERRQYLTNDIRVWCASLEQSCDSIRLRSVDFSHLKSMFTGVWFGQNPSEAIAIAFDHIPTFMAMVEKAATDKSISSKARLGMLIKQLYRGGTGKRQIDTYVKQVRQVAQTA